MAELWLIEDNITYRRAVERALREAGAAEDVRAFGSCEEALGVLGSAKDSVGKGRGRPDVVLLDVGLPGMDGIEGIGRIKHLAPETSVLVLTVFEDDEKIFRAVCAGASGYLLKSAPMRRILEAVEEARAGGSPMNPRVAKRVLTMFTKLAPAKKEQDFGLTGREREVLQLMVDGAVKKEIAERTGLNLHTVDYTMRCIYRKLHVNCQAAAVSRAVKGGLLG